MPTVPSAVPPAVPHAVQSVPPAVHHSQHHLQHACGTSCSVPCSTIPPLLPCNVDARIVRSIGAAGGGGGVACCLCHRCCPHASRLLTGQCAHRQPTPSHIEPKKITRKGTPTHIVFPSSPPYFVAASPSSPPWRIYVYDDVPWQHDYMSACLPVCLLACKGCLGIPPAMALY